MRVVVIEPYYQDELVTLYNGDCRDVLRALPDASRSVVFADPPYNVGLDYATHEDKMPPEMYREWCREWFTEARRISEGSVVITPGIVSVPMWLADIERTHLIIAWTKANNNSRNYFGPTSGYQCWEPILCFGKSKQTVLRDWIDCPISLQPAVGDHPCPKPVRLMDWIIRNFVPTGGSILDPFAGSGTTLVVAKQLGIPSVGIEIDEGYCEHITKRLAQGVMFDVA